MEPHTDQRYIEGLRVGDRQIIEEIYEKYFPKIEKSFGFNKGSGKDAHDAFQEALQVLYNAVKKDKNFTIKVGIEQYLKTICWRSVYKSKKINQLTVTFEDKLEHEGVEHIEQQIIDNEKKQLYLKHFQRLPASCQQVLQLFFAKKSMKMIAEQLGYNNDKVAKTKKSKCQKKLTQFIQNDPLYEELKGD